MRRLPTNLATNKTKIIPLGRQLARTGVQKMACILRDLPVDITLNAALKSLLHHHETKSWCLGLTFCRYIHSIMKGNGHGPSNGDFPWPSLVISTAILNCLASDAIAGWVCDSNILLQNSHSQRNSFNPNSLWSNNTSLAFVFLFYAWHEKYPV